MPGLWICMMNWQVWQAFEDTWGSKKPLFSEYVTFVYGRVLIMSFYGSIYLIMPQYALICLHMPEHDWILLNDPEYVWINCSYSAMVLNMLQYSYNNIIVTNVIRILVFLICTSRHSSIILSIFNTSYNIRITKASKLSINFSFWLQLQSI